MSYDITEAELAEKGFLCTGPEGVQEWVINGVLHHTNIVWRYDNGMPATIILHPCECTPPCPTTP